MSYLGPNLASDRLKAGPPLRPLPPTARRGARGRTLRTSPPAAVLPLLYLRRHTSVKSRRRRVGQIVPNHLHTTPVVKARGAPRRHGLRHKHGDPRRGARRGQSEMIPS